MYDIFFSSLKLKNKSKNLLIFAHPDDEILGMGGFITKNINKFFFKVIFIAEGSSCRFSENESNSEKVLNSIKLRNKMAVNSLKFYYHLWMSNRNESYSPKVFQ